MSFARKLLIWSGTFILGLLVGPIFVAAIVGVTSGTSEFDRNGAAQHLLDAYDERYPPPMVMINLDEYAAAEDCGYDERVFGGDLSTAKSQKWTPFTGYFDLTVWLADEFRDEVQRRRSEWLGGHFSSFGLTFLDRCLRQTIVAPICGWNVRQVLEHGRLLDGSSLPSPFDQPRRTQSICTYLDGIAAQRGLLLAHRGR